MVVVDGGGPYPTLQDVPVGNIRNVTFSGNTAITYGGGLFAYLPVHIDHCTFAENISSEYTNVYLSRFTHYESNPDVLVDSTFKNSLVSGTGSSTCSFYTGFVSGGHNLFSNAGCLVTLGTGDLINTNPKLGPFGYYGGGMKTYALLPGSPAIDAAGDPTGVEPHSDQRSKPYEDGNLDGIITPDIGAFEYVPQKIFIPVVTR